MKNVATDINGMCRERRSAPLTVFASALLLAGILGTFWRFTAEDAYIVARYAENLARHGELTYNLGERICALTSPLHALLSAALAALSGNALSWSKPASLLATAAALAATLWALRANTFSVVLCAAMIVPSPFIALWTVGGLETPFVLLLMTMLTLAARSKDSAPFGAGRILLAGLLIGLGFLARFDTLTYSIPVGCSLLVRGKSTRRSILSLLPGAIIAAAWLLFSKIYYHDILPTSFYVKRPEFGLRHLIKDEIYLLQFSIVSGLAPLAALIVVRWRENKTRSLPNAFNRAWGVYAGLALFFGYALTACTVHMMFAYRLLVPFIPTAALAGFDLLAATDASGPKKRPLPSPFMPACGMLLLNASLATFMYIRSINPSFVAEYSHESVRDYDKMLAVLRTQADEMRDDWRRRALSADRPARLETFAAGVVPYYDRDTYIFEQLVSFRKLCVRPHEDSADYIDLIVPRHGSLIRQLGNQYGKDELVSSRVVSYDGKLEHFMLFYHPNPAPIALPRYVDEPCRRP
ncbi:MAG TPA: hypothetical protein VG326_12005 [Tepidisphaeraceae bacterium]|jgi:hypothetical protein|nr:hypothetical protein [Tepidisphaeraceae bacterium]